MPLSYQQPGLVLKRSGIGPNLSADPVLQLQQARFQRCAAAQEHRMRLALRDPALQRFGAELLQLPGVSPEKRDRAVNGRAKG